LQRTNERSTMLLSEPWNESTEATATLPRPRCLSLRVISSTCVELKGDDDGAMRGSTPAPAISLDSAVTSSASRALAMLKPARSRLSAQPARAALQRDPRLGLDRLAGLVDDEVWWPGSRLASGHGQRAEHQLCSLD
jgi:hypothetical protein